MRGHRMSAGLRRRLSADEMVVGNRGSRLVGVVNVELSQQMVIVDGWALPRVVHGSRLIQQQFIIVASGWMRAGRPTAGHDAWGGQTGAPGALIGRNETGEGGTQRMLDL